MSVCTSHVFDFLDRQQSCAVERHEIALVAFSVLRRNLRFLVMSLSESDDHEPHEVSDRLRMLLSEWLTVPIPFDATILASFQTILGGSETIGSRWGSEIRSAYDEACKATQTLMLTDNPVRADLQTVIRELNEQARTFRIYCHRRARPHFESLAESGNTPINDGTFLHSVTDYRQAEPFDVLIKVGPLRSRGWGAAPDALLSAPRFATLMQIVWSGCDDEADFGFDPVSGPTSLETATENGFARNGHGISWTRRVTQIADDRVALQDYSPDVDEFQIFGQLNRSTGNRRATLVQIDNEQGILYPPFSKVLSFDATSHAKDPIAYRLPEETLTESMFVILVTHDDVDFGGSLTKAGTYGPIWKKRLIEEYQKAPHGLVSRLNSSGINLLHLEASIQRWSGSLVGTLPAPGHAKHFQILVEALGIDWNGDHPERVRNIPWWKCAWNEIRHARGEAIQAGRSEHEIIDEEMLSILNSIQPDIRNAAAIKDSFLLSIPAGRSVCGSFYFSKVLLIEEGFLVPDSALKIISELNAIEQWRA